MTIDELIEQVEAADFVILAHNQDEDFRHLMDIATRTFGQFSLPSQMFTLAAMFGIACASVEGELSEMEQTNGILISFEDRLRLFAAEARICYRDALIWHADPESPKRESDKRRS